MSEATPDKTTAPPGSLSRLLWFGVLAVPVHVIVQVDLWWTLFEHPTSFLVRAYGALTLAMHWLTVMLAFVAVARLVPVRRARMPVLIALTLGATFFAQVDWITYRNFHVHVLGFVQAGILAQENAMATTGLKPVAFVWPAIVCLTSWLAFLFTAWLARRLPAPRLVTTAAKRPGVTVLVVLAALTLDRICYTLYLRRENGLITEYTESIPGYLMPHTRMIVSRFVDYAQALVEITERVHAGNPARHEPVPYPPRLATSPPSRRPHVLLVVYESFRWDWVRETMPALTDFGKRAVQCANHYSNSTATHFGLFSLFYGLNPCAWWQLEESKGTPLPLQVLRDHGYRNVLVTTGGLEWYAMNEFLFTDRGFDKIDDSRIVAYREKEKSGTGYTADVEAVDAMLAELADAKQPVFGFLFLNSTHFHYYYPPECEVEKPVYDPDSISRLDFPANREKIVHRYRNGLRFADKLVRRILDGVDLSNTVVVFTGDHGEELGEHDHFFHAGDFVEEQLRVPMYLHLPGVAPRRIEQLTSHIDVFPTIFAHMGVAPRSQDFTWNGSDVLTPSRPWIVVGAANVRRREPTRFALINDELKLHFEVVARVVRMLEITTKSDGLVPKPLEHPGLGRIVDQARAMLRENVFR